MNRRGFLWTGTIFIPAARAVAQVGLRSPSFTASLSQKTGSAALKDLTSDGWQTFEFSTVDATNLGNNDGISGGTWTVSGSPTTSTSASKTALFTYNATPDTGTKGLVSGVNAENRVHYEWASTPGVATIAFWFNPGSLDSGKYSYIAYTGTGKFSAQAWLMLRNTSGTHKLSIESALSGSQTAGQEISVSPGTWYWIVMLGQNAASCKLSVFDTGGARVGVERTVTGASQNSGQVGLGTLLADTTTANTHMFDNWIFENSNKYADYAP